MSGPYSEAVLEQLMAAGRREQRRRRGIATVVTAAIAAITGSIVILLPSPAAADVHIEIENGFVEVRLTDGTTTADEVVDAFADKGLDVDVLVEPVGPSDVGRFLDVTTVGGDPTQVSLIDPATSFSQFRIRERWDGKLTITIGRDAKPTEAYLRFTDAFAALEPLDCAGVFGYPLGDAADALGGFTVNVRIVADGVPVESATLASALELHPSWVVVAARGLSASDLVLDIEQTDRKVEPGC